MAESEKDAQARWIIKQDQPACTCRPVNPKHREGWRCVTPAQLAAWLEHDQTMKTLMVGTIAPLSRQKPMADAKRLCFLWLHFSQHPEARRLSGRVVTLEESDKLNAYMALADHFGHDDATGTEWWQREM